MFGKFKNPTSSFRHSWDLYETQYVMGVVFSQNHPQVVEAARESLKKYGAGLSSVRFICGTQILHKASKDCA